MTLVHVVLCHNDSSTLRNAISFYSQLTVVIVKGFSALGTSIRITLLGIHDNLRKPWVSGSSFSYLTGGYRKGFYLTIERTLSV